MIGLFIIVLVMGGSLVFSVVLMLGVMFWTGRLSPPGSEARRLQSVRAQTKIAELETKKAELESERAEHRFRAAQAEANRQLLEATNLEELEKLRDAHFHRELAAGEATYE